MMTYRHAAHREQLLSVPARFEQLFSCHNLQFCPEYQETFTKSFLVFGKFAAKVLLFLDIRKLFSDIIAFYAFFCTKFEHSTLNILHSTPTLHSTHHTLRGAHNTIHFTLYTIHYLPTSYPTNSKISQLDC